ncbi:rhomboid family intramembrane serine protease [Lacticaseibacillus daqingensis]|uniref:rhomboid family intramembrane serine protease n=1 Tax=Lacticaseibacillus daqingensis TaxID=2486014 RepID=UPI000F7AD023|nr:rhomboid family intramembrane serine protease [Lacticaseibacillus daqingensis]
MKIKGRFPLVIPVSIILAVCWLLFALTQFSARFADFSEGYLVGDATKLTLLNSYRYVTSLFLSNNGFIELLSNSLFLILLAIPVGKFLRPGKFVSLFLATGIMGNLFGELIVRYVSVHQGDIPIYFSDLGAHGFFVGMSTGLTGIAFFCLPGFLFLRNPFKRANIAAFVIMLLYVLLELIPYAYPLMYSDAFYTLVDYGHFSGSVAGLLIGTLFVLYNNFASRGSHLLLSRRPSLPL